MSTPEAPNILMIDFFDLNVPSSFKSETNGTHFDDGTRPFLTPGLGSGFSPAHRALGRASTSVNSAGSDENASERGMHRVRTSSFVNTNPAATGVCDGLYAVLVTVVPAFATASDAIVAALTKAMSSMTSTSIGYPAFSYAGAPPSRTATFSCPKARNMNHPRAALNSPAPS
eukprot:30916-Pelagococcus_subviridis.AAC.13